ncbi:MAG: SRPBCC family protein [Candidatus Eremiobacteraeota bacterium]|nr:SRPBCC family protein [Candidatus Eremiobacteraeota bacterium]
MVTIELETFVHAPPERVFDLSRSVDLHLRASGETGEEAVGGRASGLMELGETVTWRARHFGIRQHLTSRITGYERPRWFRDEMVRGAFASLVHDHWFDDENGGTRMRDRFVFGAPLGPLGRLAERLFLRRYMTRLLQTRNASLARIAESEEWRALLARGS